MNIRDERRERKLEAHCAALADVVVAIRPVWSKAGPEQQALIETMIGAAIWYVPKPIEAWTGCISIGALEHFHPDSGVDGPRFSEEHVYPRKVAAKMLLADMKLDGARMVALFREKYGRLHYITPDENKSVQPYQRASVFSTPDEAYVKAGVKLVAIAPEHLRPIKQRDRGTIEKYLDDQKKDQSDQ